MTGEKPTKGRQRKLRLPGQPAPRWPMFMQNACTRLAYRDGWDQDVDPVLQIAQEIVQEEGPAFLKSVRRGRPTQRQNLRYLILREVEKLIGAGIPRRREDRNTPEAVKPSIGSITLSP